MPRIGMCRRPAIRSTSGLITRATALIARRVRGPKRSAFRASPGGAAGPAGEAGMVAAAAAGRPAARRLTCVVIAKPPRRPGDPAALTNKDEAAGRNVTRRQVEDGAGGRLRVPPTKRETQGFMIFE